MGNKWSSDSDSAWDHPQNFIRKKQNLCKKFKLWTHQHWWSNVEFLSRWSQTFEHCSSASNLKCLPFQCKFFFWRIIVVGNDTILNLVGKAKKQLCSFHTVYNEIVTKSNLLKQSIGDQRRLCGPIILYKTVFAFNFLLLALRMPAYPTLFTLAPSHGKYKSHSTATLGEDIAHDKIVPS